MPADQQEPPFRLTGLDHVVLRVHDLGRMLAFYRDVIGCVLEREVPDIGLYQLRAGASLIDLVPLDGKLGRAGGAGPGAEGHSMDHFCLGVAPFDEAALRRHLEAHGVRIGTAGLRNGASGPGPSLYLYDPEGNMLELKQAVPAFS